MNLTTQERTYIAMHPVAKAPKRVSSNFYAYGNGVYRVGGSDLSLCAYLVETSAGLIQVNTVPELFKTYFPQLRKLPVAVCITSPVVTQLGDTQTGFEFELWASRFMDFARPHKIKFVGHDSNLHPLYQRLELTMNGDFVHDEFGNRQAKFVSRRWVDDVFDWHASSDVVELDQVHLDVSNPDGVKIYDKQKLVFDSAHYPVSNGGKTGSLYVDMLLSQVEPLKFDGEKLGLIVGGNGIGTKPGVTSNFIFFYGNRLVWVDPPARFYEKAAQLGVNPDYATDIMITHCHEDHIEGFSALFQRKLDRAERLSLLSTPAIYSQLQTIFNPIFGDIVGSIDFHNLNDREKFQNYHGCTIDVRDNYHPVPTIGFRLSYNGRVIGVSGDTLYSKRILQARLQNGSLDKTTYDIQSSEWFSNADLFLHDTTVSKDPVHTDIEDVEDFAREIPHVKAYAYHFGMRFESDDIRPAQFGDRF